MVMAPAHLRTNLATNWQQTGNIVETLRGAVGVICCRPNLQPRNGDGLWQKDLHGCGASALAEKSGNKLATNWQHSGNAARGCARDLLPSESAAAQWRWAVAEGCAWMWHQSTCEKNLATNWQQTGNKVETLQGAVHEICCRPNLQPRKGGGLWQKDLH